VSREDYREPVSDEVKETLRHMGRVVGKACPPGWGFTLLIFTFGEGEGRVLTYISNAEREDVLRVMQEFLRKQGS
jgi:hypothetical protein